MDPYGLLPFFSAILSYFNISLNPNLSNPSTGSMFGKYTRYMKFLPFLGMPIVLFFPSGLNLYWAITAGFHLAVTASIRSKTMRKFMGIPEYLPGTILEKLN